MSLSKLKRPSGTGALLHLVVLLGTASPGGLTQRAEGQDLPEPFPHGRLREVKLAGVPVEVPGLGIALRVPAAAEVVTRDGHTWFTLRDGPEAIEFKVTEFVALAGRDFDAEVRELADLYREFGHRLEARPVRLAARGLRGVMVVPVGPPQHYPFTEFAEIMSIYVATEDRAIRVITARLNEAAEKDLDGCRALAERVLQSVAPCRGGARRDLTAGERRLPLGWGDREIRVRVPADTVAIRSGGRDGTALIEVFPLGRMAEDAGRIQVFISDHPFYEPGAKVREGRLFGKKVDWDAIADGKGIQALCDLPIGDGRVKAHVSVRAADEAHMKAMEAVAETLELAPSPPAGPK